MNKLLVKPKDSLQLSLKPKFEKFGLSENPFPSEPTVNRESTDKRINGKIFEQEIRKLELDMMIENFLSKPQSDVNHLRLGYVLDSGYIGRGNGKSAFLVFLNNIINDNYCLEYSDSRNKCFSVYVSPSSGGRTKSFSSFTNAIFESIIKSNIINKSLAILRFEAITELYEDINLEDIISDDISIIWKLNDEEWFKSNNIDINKVAEKYLQNPLLQQLPKDFPLIKEESSVLFPKLITQDEIKNYYLSELKKTDFKIDFVFTQLVCLFIAAGFNGGYILIDDFERIPDFQSSRQKKDFALELRSCLFDGPYKSAQLGFYNMLLVFHAGVPRLISDAWSGSGMENRVPIYPQTVAKHIIPFGKLNSKHAELLIKKYLNEYRLAASHTDEFHPFTKGAIKKIGEICDYNAAKILKLAYSLCDVAAGDNSVDIINEVYVEECRDSQNIMDADSEYDKVTVRPIDLEKKAKKK